MVSIRCRRTLCHGVGEQKLNVSAGLILCVAGTVQCCSVALLPAALSFVFCGSSANVVFVGVSMTFDAIVEIADSFLDMLATDLGRRMLVAAITGVTAVIVAHVASHALGFVVTVEFEVVVMIECSRFPPILPVTLLAVAADLLVQRIGW
jgi:hypothetical protein